LVSERHRLLELRRTPASRWFFYPIFDEKGIDGGLRWRYSLAQIPDLVAIANPRLIPEDNHSGSALSSIYVFHSCTSALRSNSMREFAPTQAALLSSASKFLLALEAADSFADVCRKSGQRREARGDRSTNSIRHMGGHRNL
jgi:hypothetical protein